jgi:hypothetical protein
MVDRNQIDELFVRKEHVVQKSEIIVYQTNKQKSLVYLQVMINRH